MLEGAAQSHSRDVARRRAGDRAAGKLHRAAARIEHAGDHVECGALAGAVRTDQRDDLAGAHAEAQLIHGDQSAETLGDGLHIEQQFAARRGLRARQGVLRVKRPARFAYRKPLRDRRPQAIRRTLQDHDHQNAEYDRLVVAGLADDLRQPVAQPLIGDGEHRRSEHRAPYEAGAADDRHEQILDAGVQRKRRRVHEALHVRVQPARCARHHRSEHEHDHARCPRVDAHRFGHHATALQRADRAAFARVEQVASGQQRNEHERPYQIENLTAGFERSAEHRDGGQATAPSMSAQRLRCPEQKIQTDSPCDGAQRQVVPRQPQRDQAQRCRNYNRQQQPRDQCQPWRCGEPRKCARQRGRCGQHRRRVRAKTDERCLTE